MIVWVPGGRPRTVGKALLLAAQLLDLAVLGALELLQQQEGVVLEQHMVVCVLGQHGVLGHTVLCTAAARGGACGDAHAQKKTRPMLVSTAISKAADACMVERGEIGGFAGGTPGGWLEQPRHSAGRSKGA